MKLQEKILYSRKKAGLSQEALADLIGVSRQAISKWETGDAAPELNKIVSLAKAFNVTTDWLLSEEDVIENETSEPKTHFQPRYESNISWIDTLPSLIKKMIHAYGWLFGVYLAIIGTGATMIGGLARFMVKRMLNPMLTDPFGGMMDPSYQIFVSNNPVSILGSFMMIFGVIMIIIGVSLAIILKKRSKQTITN